MWTGQKDLLANDTSFTCGRPQVEKSEKRDGELRQLLPTNTGSNALHNMMVNVENGLLFFIAF